MAAKKSKKSKTPKLLLSAVLIIVLILTAALFGYKFMLSPTDDSGSEVYIDIPSGSSLTYISEVLEDGGLVRNALVYKLYVKIEGLDSSLKAGSYTFNTSMSAEDITALLLEGTQRESMRITIREGLDSYRISNYLEETGLFTAELFLKEIKDNFDYYQDKYEFLKDVDPSSDRDCLLEGYLFGDTYDVYIDASPRDVIEKMLDRFDRAFKDEYYDRCNEMGITIDEAVTMASIVERETIAESELKTVAGVFYNRIDDGIMLQSCATLQYIYKDYQYTFTYKQMQTTNPYNTYKYKGLTPGPIANFRESALEAALYPEDHDYYYFCAKGDGTSAFAKTLSQHEANIRKYGDNWQ
ncbi:MAG: endolytic transglycosylase MltG [Eubacteriaceae bacterium]|nr:endolytic transglycosylase MltG [Eubacteriaceae bacterium]